MYAQWVAKDPTLLQADSEDSDQTRRLSRLICVFAGRTGHFVGFVVLRHIFILTKTIQRPDASKTDFLNIVKYPKNNTRVGGGGNKKEKNQQQQKTKQKQKHTRETVLNFIYKINHATENRLIWKCEVLTANRQIRVYFS